MVFFLKENAGKPLACITHQIQYSYRMAFSGFLELNSDLLETTQGFWDLSTLCFN